MSPPIKHLLKRITARAATDAGFRQGLLDDPAATVYSAFGLTLPAGHRIRFIEKPFGVDTLIVLPDVGDTGRELDDDDLEEVAGGEGDDDVNERW